MSLSSVYIRSLVGRKLMNRKWQKCRMAFGVLRKGWSEEKEEGHTEPLVIGVQVAHSGSGVPTRGRHVCAGNEPEDSIKTCALWCLICAHRAITSLTALS